MYPVEESQGVNMLLSKEVTLRKRKNEAYWYLREATTLKQHIAVKQCLGPAV